MRTDCPTGPDGKVLYRNAWISNQAIHAGNVAAILQAGHPRWKIENQNNSILKTQGYHLTHNFGHGKQHLSALLVSQSVARYPGLSREELAAKLCEWLDWRRANGGLKTRECRDFGLYGQGWISSLIPTLDHRPWPAGSRPPGSRDSTETGSTLSTAPRCPRATAQ